MKIEIKNISCFMIYLVISFVYQAGHAQKTWGEEGEIQDAQIVIEKDRKIELPEAVRNFEKVPQQAKPEITGLKPYTIKDFHIPLSDLNVKMKVLTAKQDELTKLYGNHVRLGIGNYYTTYAEGFFNNKRSDKASYGARFKHLASAIGPVDRSNSAQSDQEIGLFGKAFVEKAVLDANLKYDRETYYYYGYAPTLEFDRKNIRHNFNILEANTAISNKDPNALFSYNLGFSGSILSDNMKATENEAGINLLSDIKIGDGDDASKFIFNGNAWFSQVKDPTGNTTTRNLFKIMPSYRFVYQKFKIRAGINLTYGNDTLAKQPFMFFPDAEASIELIPNLLLYSGLNGDVERTTLKQYFRENPWAGQDVAVNNSIRNFEIYGGVRGKVLNNIAYHVKLRSARYVNSYFFTNSLLDSSRFDVQYDNATLFNYLAEVDYNYSNIFKIGFRSEGFKYVMKNLEEAWHRPSMKFTSFAGINIKNKILVNTEYYFIGGLKGKNFENNKIFKLDPISDLNLRLEYVFSNKFSAYLSVNNIFSNNYQRYLYYTSKGLNVLAGVTVSF